ncbi:glycerophosphodiester phosphodiesterase family protein [Paenibacillus mellifer]|uniref:glycerophosphodiester phosphodiesterase family protein n=1 Tax=Paenibacillus mellifer TaxID=2937794 RepID=UPI0027E0737E|nr:glycerophosphodiester phosphodiesterase family protein [Paenibacillus mellifer]
MYENDFDAEAEGTLPTGWSRIEGTSADKAAVKSGALEIDASTSPDNPSRLLLPEYLNLFGDYKIEADVTHLSANEATRWHSIMYRIQNNNYPYYQMAVRQNATAPNGVEFAERTSANAWNVMNKSAFSEPIDAGQMYHYTIQTQGNRVREFINDELLIDTDNGGSYLKGGIGLQANGSKMKVDNLRIALQLKELPPRPEDHFVQVREVDTEIAMAPSIITEFSSKHQLENMDHGQLPATVIMHVDARLRVKTSDRRTSMISLEDALDAIGNRMMPAFYVNDRQTVDALVPYLKSMELEDAFVVSDQADLVARAREGYPMLRGIMDFSKERVGTTGDLMKIRKKTTLAQSKIAILSQAEATIEHVSYLQQRTIVVWVKEDTTKHRNEQYVSLHQMITSGANGIVTTSPSEAFRALKVYSHTRTLIRKPLIIGHRGMPSVAPENTIISNELALDTGADFIENDIFLSKDGYLVIIHDSTVDSSTNGSGRVEEFTLEQLRQLQVNQVPGTYYPEARIATLEEQIDLARKRRAMIYAEIKTDNPAAVDAFVKLVKKKRAEDLINVMSFNTSQLDRLAEQLPDMPLGLLTSGYANENNVNRGLRDALRTVQTYNSTLNISYGGLGEKFMEAAHHRGLLISPWTYNNLSDYKGVFLQGAYGITTDYAYWSKDWVYSVQPEKAEYVLEVGNSMEVSANVESYNRARTAVKPSIVLLEDDGIVSVEGNRITGNKAGRTYALLRYTSVIDEENQYDVYTEPVLLVVKKGRGK